MDDTRIRQARAWIDDARTSLQEALEILTAFSDEVTNNHVDAAKISANVAIAHLNLLEAT